jgi:hypothetical protein
MIFMISVMVAAEIIKITGIAVQDQPHFRIPFLSVAPHAGAWIGTHG